MAPKPAPKKAPPAKTPEAKKPAAPKKAAGAAVRAAPSRPPGRPSIYTPELAAKVEKLERELKAHKAHRLNPMQGDLLGG